MKLNWLISGLLALCVVIILKLAGPLKGSANSDFPDEFQPNRNPLPPCPGNPNCLRLSKKLELHPRTLFDILPLALGKMNAEEIEADSQSLQIKAVFRIPAFGFRDDVLMQIESAGQEASVLHLSSRSRVGRGDLGVNRRRVKTFFRILNSYCN